MNDQKKKYLYYGIIGACLVVTVFVIFFMNSNGGASPAAVPTDDTADTAAGPLPTVNPNAPQTNTDLSELQFSVPQVYPVQSVFPTNVLNDSRISSFKDYDSLQVNDGELQKDNPFASY
jgi:hypothetical protein